MGLVGVRVASRVDTVVGKVREGHGHVADVRVHFEDAADLSRRGIDKDRRGVCAHIGELDKGGGVHELGEPAPHQLQFLRSVGAMSAVTGVACQEKGRNKGR